MFWEIGLSPVEDAAPKQYVVKSRVPGVGAGRRRPAR